MDYRFRIIASENYDGDSFDLTLDLGFYLITHQRVRIAGIDTPELRGGTEASKAAGRLARDVAAAWVQNAIECGAYFVSQDYRGKFGRPLGDVERADGERLTDALLEQRLAVRYDGGSKADVQAAHEANIQYLFDHDLL